MADEKQDIVIEKPETDINIGATTFADLIKDAVDDNEDGETEEEVKPDAAPVVKKDEKVIPAKEEKPAAEKPGETPSAASAKFVIPKPATKEEAPAEGAKTDVKPEAAKPTATASPSIQEYLKTATPEQKAAILKDLGLDDFDLQFSQFRKGGGDPYKYIETKGRDWAKVSDLDLVVDKIKKENAYLQGEDLDIMVEQEMIKYGLNEDASEAQKRIGAVMLKRDGHLARQEKITESEKFVIPTAQAEQNKEQGPSAAEVWSKTVKEHPATKSLLQNKKVVADSGKPGYKFSFDLDDETAMEVVNAQHDQETYQRYAFDETGKPDLAKESLVTLMRINPQFVIESLMDHGRELEKASRQTAGQKISKTAEVIPPGPGSKTLEKAFIEDGKDMKLGDIM